MQGELKIWQGMLARWKTCRVEFHGQTISIYQDGSTTPFVTLDTNGANIYSVVDDPLRFSIHGNNNVLHLRADVPADKVKWMRALLKGRDDAFQRSIRSGELRNPTSSGSWMPGLTAARHLIEAIDHQRQELTSLVKRIAPTLSRQVSQTASKILILGDELNANLIELAKQIDPAIPQNEVSPIKSTSVLNVDEENNVGQSRSRTTSPRRMGTSPVVEEFQDIRQMSVVDEEELSFYHSFIDQGYDGLSDFRAHSDWKFARTDSSHQLRGPTASLSGNILKKRLLSQNIVYQQLPDLISSSDVRYRLPYPTTKRNQINLLGVIKGVIGSDVFNLNLPIAANQPLSTLQRLAEQFVYEDLLVRANAQQDSSKRLLLVLAFAISGYAAQVGRTKLPLKPLIGETYELVDEKFRYISEQVNANTSAFHCQSSSYVVQGSLEYDVRFTGKAIESTPKGSIFVYLKRPKLLASFVRCTSSLTNLVFGEVELNISGEMTLNDEKNDIGFAKLKGKSSLFDQHGKTEVEGWLKHAGSIRYLIDGKYDEYLDAFEMRTKLKTRVWQHKLLHRPEYYSFTDFTIQLNHLSHEHFAKLPTTDSRLRPDIRALQNGILQLAQKEKQRLYRKQKQLEHLNPPLWFAKATHPLTGQPYYQFNSKYWSSRQYGDWQRCKDIF